MDPGPVSKVYANQVGGHPGVATTEDGSLLIKPSLPREVAFYQALATDARCANLRDFVPEFYGTLKLEGRVANEGGGLMNAITPVEESIVLENLAYTFLKPNILDIKLGTVLFDEDATPEKRARMEKVAEETTSKETGMRLTGFQVYDLAADKPVITTKAYGKSIKPADLPDGIARFFPLAAPPSPPNESAQLTPSAGAAHGTGLPPELLQTILAGILSEVEDIYGTMEDIELRMVGGSLLLVYEADWDRAREGLRLLREAEQRAEREVEQGQEQDEDEDEDGEEDDDENAVGPPFVVKLIDFAHAKLVPGRGPDEGVLHGLRTVIDLLKGRMAQVEAVSVTTLTST
ncbi:SAICAR synthase-like protein [Fomitopsis serialis]|uniref:SAICAR synthase-like protein n=1 Tax=Fomitopsis serialis TaxID=139415 RepID=UPI00200814F9|nr:SAICAR synthase-like protein [Neoantrodia serialis]KAH9930855.1 SAICAR synthase-like protein [Neoantrodia serialis]